MRRKPNPSPLASARQRRWPDHADSFRVAAIETSEVSVAVLEEAIQITDQALAVTHEPQARIRLLNAARLLAEAIGLQEYLQKLLVQARIGRD